MQRSIHELAREKGWYTPGLTKTPVENHMLIVSEIAEATEAYRDDKPPVYQSLGDLGDATPDQKRWSPMVKPEGELIELADAVIRILDYCESKGWNLAEAIELKHAYNKTRPYRHGGKKC